MPSLATGTLKDQLDYKKLADGRLVQVRRIPYAPGIEASNGPQFRGASKLGYSAGRTTSTVPNPGAVAGDLVLLHMLLENGPSDVTAYPSGFSITQPQFADALSGNGSSSLNAIYAKIAGSSEPSTYSFTHARAATEITALAYSGVNATNPFDVAGTATRGNGTTASASGLTPVTPNTLLVYLASIWNGWHENTQPFNFLQRSWANVDTGLLAADRSWGLPTATGSVSASSSTNGTDSWAAFLLALRPA